MSTISNALFDGELLLLMIRAVYYQRKKEDLSLARLVESLLLSFEF
jgi:hypothetical protein